MKQTELNLISSVLCDVKEMFVCKKLSQFQIESERVKFYAGKLFQLICCWYVVGQNNLIMSRVSFFGAN